MALIESMRPHQWVKNLLLAVPLLVGQAWSEPGALAGLMLGIVAFCLVTSGNYLLNDVLDAEADRAHPARRDRAIASGRLAVPAALAAAVLLVIAGLGVATSIGTEFLLWLIAYLALAVSYSVVLKRFLLVDVMILAALYVIRLLAGGAAIGIAVSSWLLIFAMFIFISLAFAKRWTELATNSTEASASARAYRDSDRTALAAAGPAAGMVAILVLALYVTSDDIRGRFANPDMLWLLCPAMLYWILRLWFIALRGDLTYDPLVFAARDRGSWATTVAVAAIYAAAMW